MKERLRRQSARLIDGFVEHRTRGTFDRSVALLQGDPKVWLRESVLRCLSGRGVAHAMWSRRLCPPRARGLLQQRGGWG